MDRLAETLVEGLAGTFSLYFKAHTFHWNVEGPEFVSLHKLFGDIYENMHDAVDAIAEHIRTLDVLAPSTLDEMKSPGVEFPKKKRSALEMVKELEQDNQAVCDILMFACEEASKRNEKGIENFLQDRIDAHAKFGWMLRAFAKT